MPPKTGATMSFVHHESSDQFWPAHQMPLTGDLYLLIDAAAHEGGLRRLNKYLPSGSRVSLFEGTPEEGMLDLSPWLIKVDRSYLNSSELFSILSKEYETASLSWIWST